jgi:hypothetical protein
MRSVPFRIGMVQNAFQNRENLFLRKKKRSINSRMRSCPFHFGTRSRFCGTLFFLKKRLSRFRNAFYTVLFHDYFSLSRTSKAIKGTRRSDGAKEAEGVKQGSKAREKNLIRDHFE